MNESLIVDLEKAVRVVHSCDTEEQCMVAARWISRFIDKCKLLNLDYNDRTYVDFFVYSLRDQLSDRITTFRIKAGQTNFSE
ncbi:MAG: hypothetical protein BV459_03250 [Thermoplasmata archaeon M11B2D]|nr:MAG: hypothetical protein BV459_03250 [Thermoplasmata archaeon M11B2D]